MYERYERVLNNLLYLAKETKKMNDYIIHTLEYEMEILEKKEALNNAKKSK